MRNHNQTQNPDGQMNQKTKISQMTWILAGIAIVAAAVPHYFFPTPLELVMLSNEKGWLGITVWAPAILGGMGFFLGAEFSAKFERRPKYFLYSGLAAAFAPLVLGMVIFGLYPYLSTDMAGRHPWNDLKVAIPLTAAVFALQAPFWQGIVQSQIMADWKPVARVATIVVLAVMIWLPFLHLNGLTDTHFLFIQAAEALLAALVFELGATVGLTALARGLMGVSYVWFHQAVFL